MIWPVSLTALADYDPPRVEDAVAAVLAPLGGMAAFVRPGQSVLLKPNLLMSKAPAAAVTTHPAIVRAVILQAQAAGGRVSVGDSPGVGSPAKVAEACGIRAVVEETGAALAPFSESVPVPVGAGVFRQLEVAQDLLSADVVINLPKLKTHQMMGFTCAVKNLFGAIVGMRKPGLHLQAGADKALFARMLLDLADRLAPALTIVDAVVGMEGDGPSGGMPVQLGALLAGPSPLAVDTVACVLAGLPAELAWTQRVARGLGRPEAELSRLTLLGTPLADLAHPGIRPSKVTDVHFGIPAPLRRPLTRALTARPVIDHGLCQRCGHCVTHCPPQCMTLDGKVRIASAQCIRCFCCQELCPHHAILTRQGVLLRVMRFLQGA